MGDMSRSESRPDAGGARTKRESTLLLGLFLFMAGMTLWGLAVIGDSGGLGTDEPVAARSFVEIALAVMGGWLRSPGISFAEWVGFTGLGTALFVPLFVYLALPHPADGNPVPDRSPSKSELEGSPRISRSSRSSDRPLAGSERPGRAEPARGDGSGGRPGRNPSPSRRREAPTPSNRTESDP